MGEQERDEETTALILDVMADEVKEGRT